MLMKLSPLDFGIIGAYFFVVLGVGYWLKDKMKSSSDFLLSNRNFSHWITGIAFMSANLGALEVMGHTANGAKYGMRTNNWYWIGAIPAMVFLGLFMVRYYYANGVRSVPEYLRMRYDHRAHIMNASSFAVVTILMSGIDMFAFAVVFKSMLGWPFTVSVLLASGVVLVFVFWGGLSSSIYNEFLQFFLIVLGFLPLTFLGLREVGGWHALLAKLPEQYGHTWQGMAGPGDPLGVPWWVMVVGMGLCAAPAYWCTDFLLVQRALAAKDLASAQKTPLVAAVPKMLFPGLVTVQGMLALALFPAIVKQNYNLALPALMGRYYHSGMLGLGLTALLASFMSGMAGNITAFNTVFTYDIYQTYLAKDRPDQHYLRVGKTATVVGTLRGVRVVFHRALLQQPDGLHATDRDSLHIAFLHRVPARHVLETPLGHGRLLRNGGGIIGRHSGIRALPSRGPQVSLSHGFQYLDGRVGFCRRPGGDGRGQLLDGSAPRGNLEGAGILPRPCQACSRRLVP